MHVTGVKVKLAYGQDDKLLGFACVTFDNCFVVRDIKVINGASGLFVAMPSRKVTDRCLYCGAKNQLQANYCGHCGQRLPQVRAGGETGGRGRFHADIAHPITPRCRQELEQAVLKEYNAELARSRQPGYATEQTEETDEEAAVEGQPGGAPPPARQAEAAGSDPPEPPPLLRPFALEPHPQGDKPRGGSKNGHGLGIFGPNAP